MSLVVVGAGPAGLAAAGRAAAAGHEVTVVERSSSVGGMAGSFEVAGLRVDHGSHRLHPAADPAVLSLVAELLGDDLQVRPRNGRIRLEGRWLDFPLRTTNLLTGLPRRTAAAAAADAVLAPLRKWRGREGADTFAAVIETGLGPTVARSFYGPYAHKLWDTDPTRLDGDLARRRVSASSPSDIVRRLVRRPAGRTFLYPRTGFGAISEALADEATRRGARLCLGTGVSSVHLQEDAARVTLDDGAIIDANHVWSTAPLPVLARITRPAPPDEITEATAKLRHRAMVLAYLVVDRAQWTPYDAHYFPGLDIACSRVSEPKNYRESTDDPVDRTVICAELPCWEGDDLWNTEPPALGELVADALASQGLPRPDPIEVDVRRLPRVYPVYERGYAWDLAALELWAASHPQLLVFGRQGLFVPDNTHHAIGMGLAAAAALRSDGSFDRDAWRDARAGFLDNIVED